MRQISEDKKVRVVIEFLNGRSYDDIVEIVGVSKGSIVSIIDEFRNGTFTLPPGCTTYIDELRHLAVDLKKHNTNVAQLKVYAMLHTKLKEMGANPEDAIEWLDLCREIASQNVSNNQFIESAFRLACLTSETGMTYQELITDLEAKLEKVKQLERNIEEETEKLNEVKLSHEREKKKAKETLDLLTRTIAGTHQSLEKQRKELKSQLDEYLIQNKLSWRKIKLVEAAINFGMGDANLNVTEIERLRKQIANTGSLFRLIKQLELKRTALQSEVDELEHQRISCSGSVFYLKHGEKKLSNLIRKNKQEKERLDAELESKKTKLTGLNQEISDRIENLYVSQLIIDFLFAPESISSQDLDRLLNIMIALRNKRLGIGPNRVTDSTGRIVYECQLPKLYGYLDSHEIDTDHAREVFAHLLAPLVRDRFVTKREFDMASMEYKISRELAKLEGIVEERNRNSFII